MNQRTLRPSQPSAGDHLALRYFDLGRELATWDLHQGDAQVELLAHRYRIPASSNAYYKSLAIYDAFQQDRAALQELCLPDEAGRSIGWSHIVELLQVPQAGRRRHFARRVRKENLRADALRHLIRQEQGRGSKRPSSGRRIDEPLDFSHAVARAEKGMNCIQFMLLSAKRQQQDAKNQRKKTWQLTDQQDQLLGRAERLAGNLEKSLRELRGTIGTPK